MYIIEVRLYKQQFNKTDIVLAKIEYNNIIVDNYEVTSIDRHYPNVIQFEAANYDDKLTVTYLNDQFVDTDTDANLIWSMTNIDGNNAAWQSLTINDQLHTLDPTVGWHSITLSDGYADVILALLPEIK